MKTTTTKKECGCEIEKTTYKNSKHWTALLTSLCNKHLKEQRTKKKKEKKEHIHNLKTNTEKLTCEICKTQIGWTLWFNSVSSNFICNNCKKSI